MGSTIRKKCIMKKGARAAGALNDTPLLCSLNSSAAMAMRCREGY